MGWYKMAITQQQFYSFYAYSVLSGEDLRQNPILLYGIIEHLNYIRDYYLRFLLKAIVGELGYAVIKDSCNHDNWAFTYTADDALGDGIAQEPFFSQYYEPIQLWDIPSWRDKYWNHNYYEDDILGCEDKFKEIYERDIKLKNGIRCFKLKDEYINFIEKIEKLEYPNLLKDSDYNTIKSLFNDLWWDHDFGGNLWANITEWTQRLQKNGPLPQNKYSQNLFNKIQKLIMTIDTIHSLEHNTNKVLTELPGGEHKWMQKALDIVGKEDIKEIARLSKDMSIIKFFKSEKFT